MPWIGYLTKSEGAKFIQFTGDLINGYETSEERIKLQYANWKHAVEPFWHHIPFIAGFGNHESYLYIFHDKSNDNYYEIDHFPFKDHSAESVFQDNFVNPENGPLSEDGSEYDPDPEKQDFPSYKETVFWYTYDNVAMIVLNSNYWYSPLNIPKTSGNRHGFVMDMQLKWFEETIADLEKNKDIDHIFITIHTPFFPNGGHVADDMWYNGNNIPRAYVNGRAYKKGIIERRDELLDIIVNKSKKTLALLTGDEHNYSLLSISNKVNRYPFQYKKEKLKLTREIYQINNGAAGAPYYAKEETPWMQYLQKFSTQNAVVLIDVDGLKVFVRVLNPDTGELIDIHQLKE